MPGSVRFTYGDADRVSAARANFLCQQAHWRAWRGTALLALGCAALAVLFIGSRSGDWQRGALAGLLGLVAAALLLLAICLAFYLALPRWVLLVRRQERVTPSEVVLEWDDGGMHWRGAACAGFTPWHDYHRWHEARNELLLFVDQAFPLFVPKRALSSGQLEDLRATLVAHGPPRR